MVRAGAVGLGQRREKKLEPLAEYGYECGAWPGNLTLQAQSYHGPQ